MADVKVRHKITKEIVEMSQHAFDMLHDEYEIANNPKPVIKPVIQNEKAEEKKETVLTPREQYEKLFGQKPHHKMKDENILKLIEEKTTKETFNDSQLVSI